MSFPRYPKYKPSGVEWLGDVPEHWGVVPIKWLSPVKRGASPRPIDDPKYFDEEGEYAWVRIADVSACDGDLKETTQRLSQLGSSLSVKISPGELFVSIAGTVGKPCIAAIKACIHDGFVYFPTLEIAPRFLYRIFEAGVCYGGLGKWGTQLNLNTDTVGSIRVAVPPVDELNQVLEFLDGETGKIDELVAEQRRLMELLKEKRQAVISHAVTKGLNPHAPMKPSGIEWLGDVPEHWAVVSLRYVFDIKAGGDLKEDFFSAEKSEEYPYPIYTNSLKLNDVYGYTSKCYFRANTITVTGRGDIGYATYRDHKYDAIIRLLALTPKRNEPCKYYAYFINSVIKFLGGNTAVSQLSAEQISPYKVCSPTLPERQAIVAFLETETAKFDTLTVEAQRAIVLLHERRTALISAAVTGQIDVRPPPKN